MQRSFATAMALVASSVTAYPSTRDRASVQAWDDIMTNWGYDYEMYNVTTEDEWELTLFRITGKVGEESTARRARTLATREIGGYSITVE